MSHERTDVLIFDGQCGFCTRTVEWVLPRLRQPLRALPYQAIDLSPYGLTEEDASRAAWWIGPDGEKRRGHLAVAYALIACRMPWPVLGWLLRIPPVRWLGAAGYHVVARNRRRLPGTTPACRKGWDLERGRPA